MNGNDVKALREARGLNQIQLAEFLGDVSSATVSRWETQNAEIPAWAAAKLWRTVEIPLPLEDLHTLLDHARQTGEDLHEMLVSAIRLYLKSKRVTGSLAPAPLEGTLDTDSGSLKVAEDTPDWPDWKKR